MVVLAGSRWRPQGYDNGIGGVRHGRRVGRNSDISPACAAALLIEPMPSAAALLPARHGSPMRPGDWRRLTDTAYQHDA